MAFSVDSTRHLGARYKHATLMLILSATSTSISCQPFEHTNPYDLETSMVLVISGPDSISFRERHPDYWAEWSPQGSVAPIWSVAPSNIIRIFPGRITRGKQLVGTEVLQPGRVVLSARYDQRVVEKEIVITRTFDRLEIVPCKPTVIRVGTTIDFGLRMWDRSDQLVRQIPCVNMALQEADWSTSDPEILEVVSYGVAYAWKPGLAVIQARLEGAVASVRITVTQ